MCARNNYANRITVGGINRHDKGVNIYVNAKAIDCQNEEKR